MRTIVRDFSLQALLRSIAPALRVAKSGGSEAWKPWSLKSGGSSLAALQKFTPTQALTTEIRLIYLFIYYTIYTHVKSFTIVKNRKCADAWPRVFSEY